MNQFRSISAIFKIFRDVFPLFGNDWFRGAMVHYLKNGIVGMGQDSYQKSRLHIFGTIPKHLFNLFTENESYSPYTSGHTLFYRMYEALRTIDGETFDEKLTKINESRDGILFDKNVLGFGNISAEVIDSGFYSVFLFTFMKPSDFDFIKHLVILIDKDNCLLMQGSIALLKDQRLITAAETLTIPTFNSRVLFDFFKRILSGNGNTLETKIGRLHTDFVQAYIAFVNTDNLV